MLNEGAGSICSRFKMGVIEHQCKTDDGEKCNDTWVGNEDAGSRMCYASKQEKSRNGERRKLRIEWILDRQGRVQYSYTTPSCASRTNSAPHTDTHGEVKESKGGIEDKGSRKREIIQ